ncbi:MAG: hypothetical protein ACJBCI_02915 [Candidatus Tisiphia sp.]|uniref:hypothetical protein n=1 Tax=Candidatus Tisiphia endosymbiont of Melanophora roralis TaxID=3066261 RepID=UPI001E74D61E|nr:MAG: hypothetical protein LF884_04950 [Rickettsia endosymbiont of Cimex lectularius]
MQFNRNRAIISFLKANEGQKFTSREIAAWLVKTYPEEVKRKAENSKCKSILNVTDPAKIAQIIIVLFSGEMTKERNEAIQKQEPGIKITQECPRKYYFTKKTDQAEIEEAEKLSNIKEKEVYLKLSEFLWDELSIYNMTINDKLSSNRSGTNANKWLYPDLVGMEAMTKGWAEPIKDCVKQYADIKAKLWSFEVKVKINHSNVRESFFQALSNSSWAHYGYLVAFSLVESKDSNTSRELEILSARHGIGFILLNINESEKGRILIPAKERLEIDWNMANRLVKENSDFEHFIKEVTSFYKTGETKRSDWKNVNY